MDHHTGMRSNQSQITTEYICGSKIIYYSLRMR